MTTVSRSALVPFAAAAMYRLVDDIDSYPSFLPWCAGTQVHDRTEHCVRATIQIAKGPLRKAFTTVNALTVDREIRLSLVDGPFKRLGGAWSFEPLNDAGSRVGLELDFEFSSRLVTMTVGPIFNEIANTMVSAFCSRARQVYGTA